MKTIYRIILFVFICWFGYSVFRKTLGPQESGLLDVLHYFDLIILIILSIIAMVADVVAYRAYPKPYQFYSSIVGLFLCMLVFFRLATFNNIQHASVLFKATTKAQSDNTLLVKFKENEYLQIEEFHMLGRNIYYGKYNKNKDTVIIIQTNYERFADKLPLYGILHEELLIWKNGDTMLIEKSQAAQ